MNIKELLKNLGIEEDKVNECAEEIEKQITSNYILKSEYNNKLKENEDLKEKVKRIENNKNEKGVEEKISNDFEKDDILKNILSKLEKIEKERESNILNTKKEQIKSELIKKGMNEQLSDLILKTDELVGNNEEIVKNIVEKYKDFIPTKEVEGVEPSKSNLNPNGNDKNTYSKDDLSKMSENDLNALIEKDPNFFDKIKY